MITIEEVDTPRALIIGDLHLRDDQPVCRTDDYQAEQTRKLNFLYMAQQKYGVPVLQPGDLFNKWKPSPALLNYAMENLPEQLVTIPGNHDLPQHSMDQYNRCGIAVLDNAGVKVLLDPKTALSTAGPYQITVHGFPWGSKITDKHVKHTRSAAIIHTYVMEKKSQPPFPGAEGYSARQLLNKLAKFDLVVTGDNHQQFHLEQDNRILVNPGSFMRMTADQASFEPAIYLWSTGGSGANHLTRIPIPIDPEVVSRKHLDVKTEHDTRIGAFVECLQEDVEMGMCFEENLKKYMRKNKIPKKTRRAVWTAVEGGEV